MPSRGRTGMLKAINRLRPVLALLLLPFFFGCGVFAPGPSTKPFFTDPVEKISLTSSPSLTLSLFCEAQALDPLVFRSGTRVHMGFWSLYPNRANLARVINAINSDTGTTPYNKAIWDEGTTTAPAMQFPSYIRMNDEFWYERASASEGTVTLTIEGVTYTYTDPRPVTFAQADTIWGQYSQRYTDLAPLIRRSTGLTPEARCFVEGAKSNRVFYTYELPQLEQLETSGDIIVYFASTSEANWKTPADWVEGTKNAPTPVAP